MQSKDRRNNHWKTYRLDERRLKHTEEVKIRVSKPVTFDLVVGWVYVDQDSVIEPSFG